MVDAELGGRRLAAPRPDQAVDPGARVRRVGPPHVQLVRQVRRLDEQARGGGLAHGEEPRLPLVQPGVAVQHRALPRKPRPPQKRLYLRPDVGCGWVVPVRGEEDLERVGLSASLYLKSA